MLTRINYCTLGCILCAGVAATSVSESQLCCRGKQLLRTPGSRKILVGARWEQQGFLSWFPRSRTCPLMGQFKGLIPRPRMKMMLFLGHHRVGRAPKKVITFQELQLCGEKKPQKNLLFKKLEPFWFLGLIKGMQATPQEWEGIHGNLPEEQEKKVHHVASYDMQGRSMYKSSHQAQKFMCR